jgi:hypothetical protein
MNRRGFLTFWLASWCSWLSKLTNTVRVQDKQAKTQGRLRLEEFWAEDR